MKKSIHHPYEKEYKDYDRKKEGEEKLLDRFRDPRDPLKLLIVTSDPLTPHACA